MTLGYFIDSVWGVRFNSECIIEWCNDDVRAVKIFVNGRRSYEYERYVMHDEDDITIVYEETLNERTTSDFQIF